MAVKEFPDLVPGQALRSSVEGLADAPGRRIDRGGVEEETSTCLAVVPYGQGGVQMGGFDDGAAIEGSIDGAEPQDLGFGPAGGGAAEALGLLERIASPTFEWWGFRELSRSLSDRAMCRLGEGCFLILMHTPPCPPVSRV